MYEELKRPLFSIVIVNYDHGRFLGSAIESVLTQSCQDFELIVVDGGSSDNSVEVIEKFSSRISWWVSESDAGQSDAFNKGFSHARGRFFLWLNADDLLLRDSLLRVKLEIDMHPNCSWFAANTIFFDEKALIKRCVVGPKWVSWLVRNNPIYVYGPSSIFSRDIFFRAGGFDASLNYAMDGDLWLKFHNMGERFTKIHYFVWGFRVHPDSKTSHAFDGKPSDDFANERKAILLKNGHVVKRWKALAMTGYKWVSGCYFSAIISTVKYKSKPIAEFL